MTNPDGLTVVTPTRAPDGLASNAVEAKAAESVDNVVGAVQGDLRNGDQAKGSLVLDTAKRPGDIIDKESPREPSTATSTTSPTSPTSHRPNGHRRVSSSIGDTQSSPTATRTGVSEWSHQQLAVQPEHDEDEKEEELQWQEMPAYAPFDIYDDDGKLIAKEAPEEAEAPPGYGTLGGPAKGYSRVVDDEDAKSTTSMDENTSYLFKEPNNRLDEEDEDARDVLSQMQMTKEFLTDNQRIAYVGIVKLAIAEMGKTMAATERSKGSRKLVDLATESLRLWGQKMMVRLYGHMELESAEQVMIEQLAEHGLQPSDLTPSLMSSSKVKNPAKEHGSTEDLNGVTNGSTSSLEMKFGASTASTNGVKVDSKSTISKEQEYARAQDEEKETHTPAPPPYKEAGNDEDDHVPHLQQASELVSKDNLDVDLRWTVLCDLFLILIANSNYDARSRVLLEKVAGYLEVTWIDVCRFEKRVTEALEMEEESQREELDETDNMEKRRKRARRRRLAMMGLATVGGGLVIGLSAGLLAPVIGAGLAAGFTTIGITGTSTFLGGAGAAALIGSVSTVAGGTIGVRAANRRTGAVKTFEYRPLHNNKRVNLIVTVSGWMVGKVDDVRLPFSTVDPLMGDLYSVYWEPDMLRSVGDTINILATEALTQGLQQLLGSTILISLMAALQLPIVLSKLSYLIDNPWSVSVARADAAGLIFADSLIERNLGARPITLVGYSIGSRVIFAALKELANKGALGLIQNVYLFGTPVVVKKNDYLKARTVVAGRFVNAYATNDWILGYLFRATGGGIMRVAGLAKVEVPGIENVDVTKEVPGHMAYRTNIPKLLRKMDWAVTSDEFNEIEDPDPDNHEKRQRELINEIEEARAELEAKPEKRRFGIFRRNQQRAKKKNWETYDETSQAGDAERQGDPNGPLFDVDAIRREAIELAAEGIEIKQLESTMPPMKIDSSALTPPMRSPETNGSRAVGPALRSSDSKSQPASPTTAGLGFTKSDLQPSPLRRNTSDYDHTSGPRNSYFNDNDYSSPSDQLSFAHDDVQLSFEVSHDRPPSLPPKPIAGTSRSPSPRSTAGFGTPASRYGSTPNLVAPPTLAASSTISLPPNPSYHPSRSASPSRTHLPLRDVNEHKSQRNDDPQPNHKLGDASEPGYNSNPWADDDDDFGHEQEVSMTFA